MDDLIYYYNVVCILFFFRCGWTISFQYLVTVMLDVMTDNRFVPACKVSIYVFDGLIMFVFDQ